MTMQPPPGARGAIPADLAHHTDEGPSSFAEDLEFIADATMKIAAGLVKPYGMPGVNKVEYDDEVDGVGTRAVKIALSCAKALDLLVANSRSPRVHSDPVRQYERGLQRQKIGRGVDGEG